MLTTIKGYYDHGHLTLEETPPADKTPVMVTFLNEVTPEPKKRKLGGLEGKVNLPDDFNEPLDDLKDYM
ncbi:DUF2281 domain-containing protein [Mucilaginibacter sp.]|jgi:hypothetical protein|uniref:DUF2281 domain-containing protein n=1 Tax=Mucilaginibacter sp. TaxID=1882438 RepID=UPI0025F58831|nr:DUF2281 domain-containing protein [Mucilaginibacter sp.]